MLNLESVAFADQGLVRVLEGWYISESQENLSPNPRLSQDRVRPSVAEVGAPTNGAAS